MSANEPRSAPGAGRGGRAAGAGVVIEIEGETFKSSGSFYTWLHGRYHALEDGYDDWVGIDD